MRVSRYAPSRHTTTRNVTIAPCDAPARLVVAADRAHAGLRQLEARRDETTQTAMTSRHTASACIVDHGHHAHGMAGRRIAAAQSPELYTAPVPC